MRNRIQPKNYVILSVVFSTIVMCIVDGIIVPPYFVKSGIKIFMFLLIPMIYFIFYKDKSEYLKKLFAPQKKDFLLALGLGVSVFTIILGAYFLLRPFIDLSTIEETLVSGTGVTAENFLFVAIYISFVNSLLEEFFFRGYAFLILKKEKSKKFAYIFSSFMFALYHVGMTSGWFSVLIYFLSMLGLFVGGCIFNFLNDKCENIYPSWLVHMCANFAINIIGFILFGIIK